MARLESVAALITGASSGIGRGLARVFLEEGARVFLTARGEARLRETAAAARSRPPRAGRVPGLRCRGPGLGGGDDPRRARVLPRSLGAREQRLDPRRPGADPRSGSRALGRGAADQHGEPAVRDQAAAPGVPRARVGLDHQLELDRRPGGEAELGALRGLEVRPRGVHPDARRRARRDRGPGEQREPGRDAHPDAGPGVSPTRTRRRCPSPRTSPRSSSGSPRRIRGGPPARRSKRAPSGSDERPLRDPVRVGDGADRSLGRPRERLAVPLHGGAVRRRGVRPDLPGVRAGARSPGADRRVEPRADDPGGSRGGPSRRSGCPAAGRSARCSS